MIAWFAILAVVPLNALRTKVGEGRLPNRGEEVFVGVFGRQAERAPNVFVLAIGAGGVGEERRTGLELCLLRRGA